MTRTGRSDVHWAPIRVIPRNLRLIPNSFGRVESLRVMLWRAKSVTKTSTQSKTESKRSAAPGPPLQHVEWVPLVLTTALFLISFTARVQQNAVLTKSFWAACAGLLVWQGLLLLRARRSASPV